jgi:actin-related protein
MDTYDKSIVIQNGSSLIRCGISGNDRPYAFPSVIGTPKYPELFGKMFGT